METWGDRERVSGGSACILVREKGLDDMDHPFWNWLRDNGFKSWAKHGHYLGVNWVFINLDSMVYAPGMPGVPLAAPIRRHAITADEFRTIWEIFRKYDGLPVLKMPDETTK